MKIKNERKTKFVSRADGLAISQADSFEYEGPQTVVLSMRQLLEAMAFIEKKARLDK